ncbi:hypothetical protein RSAG8_04535, partial [Rhizoctonia solani AG-8 WAC10335]
MVTPEEVLHGGKTPEIEGSTAAISSPASSAESYPAQRRRSMTPLLWPYELARGGLFVVQSFLVYAIMLAVMSFNAAYNNRIVVGTGLGEILFGRFTVEQTH